MKYAIAIGLLTVAAFAQAGDRTVDVKSSDQEMNAAIARAQASLDGQKLSFQRRDITDWGYEENGTKKGFFTVCVMLKHMSTAEVRQYRQDGFQC